MNRKQYFAVSVFCVLVFIISMTMHWGEANAFSFSNNVPASAGEIRMAVQSAIFSVLNFSLIFLFMLFAYLGLLEPKKKE